MEAVFQGNLDKLCQSFLIVHQKCVGTFYTVTIQKTEER